VKLIVIAGFAAAGLLSGCGGSASSDQPAAGTSVTAASTPSPTAAASTPTTSTSVGGPGAQAVPGTIAVRQRGTQPAKTLWFLRVENPAAKPLFEHRYAGMAISQTLSYKQGDYRVIAYSRPCSDTCPATGEDGLGELAEVCGIKVHVTPAGRVPVTVSFAKDGNCSFTRG